MVGQIVLCMVILFSGCFVGVNLPQFDLYVICGFNCVIGGTVVQERVLFSNQAKLYSNACLKTM